MESPIACGRCVSFVFLLGVVGARGTEDAHAPFEALQVRESCLRVHRVRMRLAYFSFREDVNLRKIRHICRDQEERRTHPRACAQLLDRGVDCGLVYAYTTKRLEYLTFPEECRKDSA